MSVLLGTLVALLFCALALGLGSILGAGPPQAGCSHLRRGLGCSGCPNRRRSGACKYAEPANEDLK